MTLRGAVDRLVGAVETPVVRALRLRNRFPPLFIVGAPRSATTVVYQHIVYAFQVAYFPNLSRRFPRACVTAAAVARLLGKPPPTYESRFGEMEGASAPSDGWEVFHRWFPRYDYSVPVREDRLHELRTIVLLLERLYGGPFVNKNNSSSVRIRHLAQLFPDAFFLHVERDFHDTVGSILRGRRANGIPPDQWWGAPPPQMAERTFDSELERVVAQVWGLRERIHTDLRDLPDAHPRTVRYDEFCQVPGELLDQVRAAYRDRGVMLEGRGLSLPEQFEPRRSQAARDPAFRERVAAATEALGIDAEAVND